MKILYDSGELQTAIKDVLAEPQPHDRRVALVAFVGGEAETFIPDPTGLEIVCWLKPGSSDALTIDRLRKRGAKIYESKGLHMKVYWSSSRGCVICSADASGNALGGGGQKEAGVWLPPGQVDIERLWTYAQPQPITDIDLKRLTPLGPPPDFLEWQTVSGRRDWKLGWWYWLAEFAKDAVKKAKQSYGVIEPNDFVNVKKGQVRADDWVLLFRLPNGTGLKWMHADFVIEVDPSDKVAFEKEYPFQAVQANPPRKCPPPPFEIDEKFRRAFKEAVKKYGAQRIENLESLLPPKALLGLIATSMRAIT
jgi:hypothetical protein